MALSQQIKNISSVNLIIGDFLIEKLIKEKRYTETTDLLEKTKSSWVDLLKENQRAERHYLLADLYLKTEDLEKSREEYNRAIELGYKPYIDFVGGFFNCLDSKTELTTH